MSALEGKPKYRPLLEVVMLQIPNVNPQMM